MTTRLPAPVDAHTHLRAPGLEYVKDYSGVWEHVLAMPNTDPPLLTADAAKEYADRVALVSDGVPLPNVLRTCYLTPDTDPQEVVRSAGRVAGWKLYPRHGTTNSGRGWGWEDLTGGRGGRLDELAGHLKYAAPLLVHAEMPDPPGGYRLPPWERERAFVTTVLPRLAARHPALRVVVEHATCRESLDWVRGGPNRAATITYHHLTTAASDWVGPPLRPHLYCMPVAKTDADRGALQAAAFSGDPRFMLGSDSAPHPRDMKEGDCCRAGVYTAPHLAESVAMLFSAAGRHDELARFWSLNAREWYGLPAPGWEVEVRDEEWTVPAEVRGSVPMRAGTTVPVRVVRAGG